MSTKGKQLPQPAVPPVDPVTQVVGDFGVWQLRTMIILMTSRIPAAWFMACIIFTGPELIPPKELQCADKPESSLANVTKDQCYIVDTNKVTQCESFKYNYDFYSFIMQYNLVCAREIFVAWTQYWHLFGVLLGGVIGTLMMRKISPKTVFIIGNVCLLFSGVITGYSPYFSLHCAFRCISATFCLMMVTSGQAIVSDITTGIYRIAAMMFFDVFWAIGLFILPGIASFFKNWAHIYLGITFPAILILLFLPWIPDAPRWILKNRKKNAVAEAEKIIRRGADLNLRNDKIPPNLQEELEKLRNDLQQAPPNAKWPELWRGAGASRIMIAAHLAASFYVIDFMGMLLNMRSFGREYLVPNTLLMGVAEVFGSCLALHLVRVANRWKYQWAGALNIVAGSIGCLGWLFSNNDKMDPLVKVSLWMIIAWLPKASVSCGQSLLLACMGEQMPANKKFPFVFSVVTFSRILLLAAPFFNVLKKFDVALSLTSYCVMCIVAGALTCLLMTPSFKESIFKTEGGNRWEQAPLNIAVWTVDTDTHNTRL